MWRFAAMTGFAMVALGCSLWIEPGENGRADSVDPVGDGDAAPLDGGSPLDARVPSSCPSGYASTTQGCFYLLAAGHTAVDAEEDCEQTLHMNVRAHLAVIENPTEAAAAAAVMGGEELAYVGLLRYPSSLPSVGDQWRWVTGGTFVPGGVPFMVGGHPQHDVNGECAVLVGGESFVKVDCSLLRVALCEWDGEIATVAVP